MSIKPVKGLRSYYPTDKGPIDTYQLGHGGRVEYLAAEIGIDHVDKGSESTGEWQKWAKEFGEASDVPGLILSNRLGGSGTDKTNLFPKSPSLDGSTTWSEHEKAAYAEAAEMKKWKKVKFVARLEYPSDDSTRPAAIEYQYDLPSGTVLYGKVSNSSGSSKTEEEEAEEEEEEVEEEEAEEEIEEEEEAEEEPAKAESPLPASPTPEPIAVVSPIISVRTRPKPPPVEEERPVSPPGPPPKPVERPPVYTPPPPPSPPPSYSPPPRAYDPPAPRAYDPPRVAPAERDDYNRRKEPPSKQKSPTKEKVGPQESGVITKSDLIDLIPVIGSCKLAVETVQAAYNGNGKLALRKAVQCGISLVADFYLGRAIARHGQILAQAVTEQTVIRFVTKAENQIIIVSSFKASNQLLNTISRAFS